MMEEKIWDLQEKYHADIRLLVTPLMHVASHELRQLIKEGQDLLAGLLHDCAKCIPGENKIKMCEKYHLNVSEVERENPSLLHAKLGAFLAAKKYHIEDKEIINAIASHTTGHPHMTLLEKIIYIADYIEPGRPELAAGRNLQTWKR